VPVPFFDRNPLVTLRKKGTDNLAATFLLMSQWFTPRSQSPFSAIPAR